MLRNYLLIAYRNLLKNKVYSLINILGLSAGIFCCLIVGIYILHELSYDRFFPNAERIYRVVQEQEQAEELYQVAITPAPLVERLKADYPDIEEAMSFSRIFNKMLFQYQDKRFEESGGFHVDSSFFKILPFTVHQGSLQTFSVSPQAIVLSESMAYKYFGDQDPIGKVLTIDRKDDFVVQAVLKDVPENAHLKFNFLLPLQNLRSHRDFESWGNNWMYTYILLKKSANALTFEGNIKNLLSENIGNPDWQPRLYLQALTDIHLRSDFDFNTDIADTSSILNIYLFGAIGLVIVFISCINFINLTTARSSQRTKEVGVRKVVGASRKQLIYQFVGESLMYAFLATIYALTLVQLLIPYVANLSGLPLSLNLLNTKDLVILLWVILFTTGLLAGIYPALFLSAFNTIKILKGLSFLNKTNNAKHLSLRKVLVISQFTLSIILIVSAIIIRQQMHYVLHRNLGFDQEHILYAPLKGDLQDHARFQSFKSALLQHTAIVQVSQSNGLPIHHEGSFGGVDWEGKAEGHADFLMHNFHVDEAFVETFGLQLLAGNDFTPRKPNDTLSYYLVNETAMKVMQMDHPVGKKLGDGEIIGVVRDFNFQSAFNPVEPMILCSEPANMKNTMSIRIASGNMREAITILESVYKEFIPDYPFEYHFLDESIKALYDKQSRSAKLINLFAVLAVFISGLGLFGLSVFTAEQRTKEVGIRKVLGASALQITQLLSFSFLKLVVVSILIAAPCSYWMIRYWLDDFAYRITIRPLYFIIAGGLTLLIAVLTISYQTIKTAHSNPVDSLKYE